MATPSRKSFIEEAATGVKEFFARMSGVDVDGQIFAEVSEEAAAAAVTAGIETYVAEVSAAAAIEVTEEMVTTTVAEVFGEPVPTKASVSSSKVQEPAKQAKAPGQTPDVAPAKGGCCVIS
eukprot:CAMPEP_0181217470 /NCGR_PEP_ID=MMETSP1096-20121128/27165_1 /TAXON_ID=156174 ORGANISM="Chrysochromulina ericina, Strain CCMP281" /NCGR_SAMPLE_ID=MMETSP1096 /ASSEMBLY_ACC=CAM_ASM_000453 /LENGTH=120 /DNA_ID=CAMNT_0023309597 /DNA_START=23 /DNA_END=385 /DNA_ORIENTATION=+